MCAKLLHLPPAGPSLCPVVLVRVVDWQAFVLSDSDLTVMSDAMRTVGMLLWI